MKEVQEHAISINESYSEIPKRERKDNQQLGTKRIDTTLQAQSQSYQV